MHRVLRQREARRLLRNEIWRRGCLYLLPAALLAGFSMMLMARGLPYLSTTHYDHVRPMDGALRWSLTFIAFMIAFGVARIAPGLGHQLRRLPVDPVAGLQARLQLATTFGVVVFTGFLIIEFAADPIMMHPSFSGRLNLAETETLARLPGVPLLRFTVDGKTTRGLASELSVAAIRPGKTGDVRISSYGTTSRWPHFRYDPPAPGEVLAALDGEDWPKLEDIERRQLQQLGVPAGAMVKIELERYVSRAEYLAQPWRRDGLGRERRWHAFDRAIGFLGLLVFLTCALNPQQTSVTLAVAGPFSIFILQASDFALWRLRSGLLFSDLEQGSSRFPSFNPQQTVLENLIWPIVVVMACAVAYTLSVRQLRREPFVHTREGEGSIEILKRHWRSGFPRRVELIAVILFFGVWFGATLLKLGFDYWLNAHRIDGMAWTLGFLAVVYRVIGLTGRWARRDALLSRLPIPAARIAWRRLGWTTVTFVGIALMPLAIGHAMPFPDVVNSGHAAQRFGGDTGWAKSLLVIAGGSLIMIFALLDSWRLSSRLAAVLCLSGGLIAMPMLTLRELPWLTALSLAVVAAGLPVIHRLMQRRVELGRAPAMSELLTPSRR